MVLANPNYVASDILMVVHACTKLVGSSILLGHKLATHQLTGHNTTHFCREHAILI
jgi:hypothetical protein